MAYRVQPLLRRVLGTDNTLRMLLNVERVAWRIAFEAAHLKQGDAFSNASVATTPDLLTRWVPDDSDVLDIGCGSGRLERVLAGRVRSMLGIDYDEVAIEAARASIRSPHIRFEVGDARDLRSESRYTIATLIHVLEHIDDPLDLLKKMADLAPRVIIEVPAFDRCVLNPIRVELGLDFSTDDDHVREYSQPLLEQQLEAAGWAVADWARGPMSIAVLATPSDGAPASS